MASIRVMKPRGNVKPEPSTCEKLCVDLCYVLFAFLSGKNVIRLRHVCRYFCTIITESSATKLWHQLYLQDFRHSEVQLYHHPPPYTLQHYQRLHIARKCKQGAWCRVPKFTNHPPRLQGSAGAAIGPYFIIHGGWSDHHPYILNSTFALDTRKESDEWLDLQLSGTFPPRTYGHSLTRIYAPQDGLDCVMVFGGLETGGYFGENNCLSILESNEEEVSLENALNRSNGLVWWQPVLLGPVPRQRAYHTATFVPATAKVPSNRLIIFGGFANHSPLASFEMLDLDRNEWQTLIPTGTAPCARFGHSAVLINQNLFVLGGCDGGHNHKGRGTSGMELRDLFILDTECMQWSTPNRSILQYHHRVDRCHTAVVVGDCIVCFGGGASDHLNNDIVCINTATMACQSLDIVSTCLPQARQNHVCALVGTRMYVYGGWRYGELGDCKYLELDPDAFDSSDEVEESDEEMAAVEDLDTGLYRNNHRIMLGFTALRQLAERHQHGLMSEEDVNRCVQQ